MGYKLIGSPVTYNGNKLDLMDDILPLVEKAVSQGVETFNDVFGGSATVSLNVAKNTDLNINMNEFDDNMFAIHKTLRDTKTVVAVKDLQIIMNKFEPLIGPKEDAYYKANYVAMKDHINEFVRMNPQKAYMMIALIRCCFSSTPRWNKSGIFNASWGDRTWTPEHLFMIFKHHHTVMNNLNGLSNEDFNTFFGFNPSNNSVLDYVDPPYRITYSNYQHGWNEDSDLALFRHLDRRAQQGGKFIMSNVTHHRGQINQLLLDWMAKYSVEYPDKEYFINNKHGNTDKTVEVLVHNLG